VVVVSPRARAVLWTSFAGWLAQASSGQRRALGSRRWHRLRLGNDWVVELLVRGALGIVGTTDAGAARRSMECSESRRLSLSQERNHWLGRVASWPSEHHKTEVLIPVVAAAESEAVAARLRGCKVARYLKHFSQPIHNFVCRSFPESNKRHSRKQSANETK
jgi:hypothetical protein